MTQPTRHHGSCHCGAVRFHVDLDLAARPASRCNCRICTKVFSTGAIVKPDAFTLDEGADALSSYPNAIGARFFCKRCGVHCYGNGNLEVLGGDFVSVNLNAVDDLDVDTLTLVHWDGRHDNWMAGPRPTPWARFHAGS